VLCFLSLKLAGHRHKAAMQAAITSQRHKACTSYHSAAGPLVRLYLWQCSLHAHSSTYLSNTAEGCLLTQWQQGAFFVWANSLAFILKATHKELKVPVTMQGPLRDVYQAALGLGTANQLTNILRDVGEDITERNRIYVPTQELKEFGIAESEVSCSTFSFYTLLSGVCSQL